MFAVGLPTSLQAFFMISSMVIAVPTGIKIFNWLATLWRGNISFDTPMLFALGFLGVFVDGRPDWDLPRRLPRRLAGARHATSSSRTSTTRSSAASMFAIFAGLFYWWPKMFGRTLDEKLGKWQFWLVFDRLQPHVLPAAPARASRGCRAASTRTRNQSWEGYNMASTIGAYVMARRLLFFVWNVIKTTARAARASATTRGRRTRSSGTRPRRRRRTTSTRCRT